MAVSSEQLPMTVSQYAAEAKVSRSTVARMIRAGCLRVNGKKPREIVAIVFPETITVESWKRELSAAAQTLRPGTYGFDDSGRMDILVGDRVVSIGCGETVQSLVEARQRVEQLAHK